MTDTTTNTRSRGIRLLGAAIAALAITVLTLAPRGLVAPARGAFVRLMEVTIAPLPDWIHYGEADRVLNTLLFVPLGATLALLLSRGAWPAAIVAGLALSAAVEYAQVSIPGRVPDPADMLWNTVGGAIGVAFVTVPRLAAAAMQNRQRGRAMRT